MIAGIMTSTPSMASPARAQSMPASSMARLLASSVKPIVLTPWSFPKRDVAAPTMAYRPLRLAITTEDRGQTTEDRGQRTDDRRQRTEDRRRHSEHASVVCPLRAQR